MGVVKLGIDCGKVAGLMLASPATDSRCVLSRDLVVLMGFFGDTGVGPETGALAKNDGRLFSPMVEKRFESMTELLFLFVSGLSIQSCRNKMT